MHFGLAINALLLLAAPGALCVGISSKLDFGDEEPAKAANQRQAVVTFKSNAGGGVGGGGEFESIGVVCTSSGCNKTDHNAKEVKISDKTDTIIADVLVRIKTKINFDEKGGKNATKEEEAHDVPVVIGYADASENHEPHEGGAGRSASTPAIKSPPFAGIERVHVASLSSTLEDEPKIPYFAFNNRHYYSEHIPAQVVWYPKNSVNYNPVEFKANAGGGGAWGVGNELWPLRAHTTSYHHRKYQAPCACQNQDNGLAWYPTGRSRKTFVRQDPGSQINDKLAPLD